MRDIPAIHSFRSGARYGSLAAPGGEGRQSMISPYLRRPLRSLDEIKTREDRPAPAAGIRASAEESSKGAPAHAVDSVAGEKETSIASNR
jgi:hypothetical protein